MDIWVLVVIVGVVLILLGLIVTIAGIIVDGRRKSGREAAAVPDIWAKIVDFLTKTVGGLVEKILGGSVTALGLLLIVLGTLCIGGGIWGAATDDGDDQAASTTPQRATTTT
jgi:hypothetical protein